MSKNKHDDADDDELKRKLQVFEIGGDSDSDSEEELFEINLINNIVKEGLDTIKEEYCESTVFSIDILDKDVVYVAVGVDGAGASSMEALSWALKHAVTPSSTTVTLIHVFPQLNLIPTPLGRIPRSRVNPEHINIHLTQEKTKRKLLLHKFIHLCVESKVKVEIMLIEGDNIAKAILDLVRNLNIRKLVIGTTTTTPSNLRKAGTRKQNCIAEMVLKNAQEMCDIKIICEGTEVIDQMINNDYDYYSTTTSLTSNKSSSNNSISRVSPDDDDDDVDESHGNGTVVPVPVPLKQHLTSNPFWLFIRSRFLSPWKRKNYLDQLELVLPTHYLSVPQ